jgi:hypothetical protein
VPRRFAPILTLALLTTGTAHAGPTVAADLDLGTSTTHAAPGVVQSSPVVVTSPLYMVGFTLRAGWRFDVGSFFLQPEIGGGYAVERDTIAPSFTATTGVGSVTGTPLGRFFGGGRAGFSGVLGPRLRIEPAIFGHAGVASYGASPAGSVFDAGVSLDLRIRGSLLVGVHGGYDVVTVWHPAAAAQAGAPKCVSTATGPVCLPPAQVIQPPPRADPWVGYGVHAGWLFW